MMDSHQILGMGAPNGSLLKRFLAAPRNDKGAELHRAILAQTNTKQIIINANFTHNS